MSKRNWTESQRWAISARNGSLLVSAAAGSGKTAVLVQRVIERLTDPERPLRRRPAVDCHLYQRRRCGNEREDFSGYRRALRQIRRTPSFSASRFC